MAILGAACLLFTVMLAMGMMEIGFTALHVLELQDASDATAMANAYLPLVMPSPEYTRQATIPTAHYVPFNARSGDSGTETLNPMSLGSQSAAMQQPSLDQSTPSYASAFGPHLTLSQFFPHTANEVRSSNVALSQFQWINVDTVPVRVVLILDMSVSMTLATATGPSALAEVVDRAKGLLDPSKQGYINWGFFPYAADMAQSQLIAVKPIDCRGAALSQGDLQNKAAEVYTQIDQHQGRLGSGTNQCSNLEAAIIEVAGWAETKRYPNSPRCGAIKFMILSDGEPTTSHSTNNICGTTATLNGVSVAVSDAKTAVENAVDPAKDGPRSILSIVLDRTYGSGGGFFDENQAVTFMQSIACDGELKDFKTPCTHSSDSNYFIHLQNSVETLDVSTDTLRRQMHCRGSKFRPPQDDYCQAPDPNGIIMSGFWLPSGAGGDDETFVYRRASRYDIDSLPPTATIRPAEAFFYDVANESVVLNSAMCSDYVDSFNTRRPFRFRMRWGTPILNPNPDLSRSSN
jgi:hypothetical protein